MKQHTDREGKGPPAMRDPTSSKWRPHTHRAVLAEEGQVTCPNCWRRILPASIASRASCPRCGSRLPEQNVGRDDLVRTARPYR